MKELGIYVHIPFCKKKCKYCDFTSFCLDEKKIEKYFEVLEREIEKFEVDENYKVSTVYFGGGTPSYPNEKYIVSIYNKLIEKFGMASVESTIEVNPGTITPEKLNSYKKVGFNRLSIGLQSTNERLLKLIGRIHTYDDLLETYSLAQKAQFENINVDLMLALPTQTMEELVDSLEKVIKINPNHISLYSLILEDGTDLKKQVDSGMLMLPDEKTEREMYWKTKDILEKNGYIHYEISNFAKRGFESKHNMNCWNQEEYIGFGLAAHSYYKNKRFSNTSNFEDYISEKNKVEIHEIQKEKIDIAKEYMMLGLRKIDGISISEFEKKFNVNPLFYFRFELEDLTKKGLIEIDLDSIKLTDKGIDLANIVFEEFI